MPDSIPMGLTQFCCPKYGKRYYRAFSGEAHCRQCGATLQTPDPSANPSEKPPAGKKPGRDRKAA